MQIKKTGLEDKDKLMLKIKTPNNNIHERNYILDIMFNEFLGLEYEVETNIDCMNWQIQLPNNSILIFEDHFFNAFQNDLEYLKIENIPHEVMFAENEFTPETNIPVLYGTANLTIKTVKDSKKQIVCGIDILASSFFMLTRWEEHVNKNRDIHDRFMATESLAFKQHFLDRPVVNEYAEMLKSMLLHLDETLDFRKHNFHMFVSCDVDMPFDCTVEKIVTLLRVCAGDLLKRKSVTEFFKRIRRYIFNKIGNYKYDENYTFDWYMDECEKNNLKMAFYFIPDSSENNNGCYSLQDPKIQTLLQKINNRMHEIGIHGSYQTYQNKAKTILQKKMFDKTLEQLDISQKTTGNRQHYLRWDSCVTPRYLDASGFLYDTTGSYADMPGFRYGICFEFSMFDFLTREKLKLRQRPLIVMECTVIDEAYMGLGYTQEAIDLIKNLKKKCFKYDGNFSLLWHNSHFKNIEDKNMFKEILRA